MQNCKYADVRELDARWRIKERNLMKRHLKEQIQLLSRQRDEKLKLITAKRNVPSLTDDEVEEVENQLTSQMNQESSQEVNCSLIGIQNEKDRKELKRSCGRTPQSWSRRKREGKQRNAERSPRTGSNTTSSSSRQGS